MFCLFCIIAYMASSNNVEEIRTLIVPKNRRSPIKDAWPSIVEVFVLHFHIFCCVGYYETAKVDDMYEHSKEYLENFDEVVTRN